jgi:penicillin-binding protein-related factor A (putative recombinase)
MQEKLRFGDFQAPDSHANRGRQFEAMLERTHDFYTCELIGDITKISNRWEFCSEGEWRRLPPALKARTGDGKPLKRAQTVCDYLGHAYGYGVAFDAKEFNGPSIPLENFKVHQVRGLYNYERTRGLAGFLVWSKRADKVYWVCAQFMMILRSAGTLKSLNIKWLDEHAVLITEKTTGALVDWARVLLYDKANTR